MGSIKYVELDEFQFGKYSNVLRADRGSIVELAKSILKTGLLNPLLICANEVKFDLADGKKRLLALLFLRRSGKLPRSLKNVPCELCEPDVRCSSKRSERPSLLSDVEFFDNVMSRREQGQRIGAICADLFCSTDAITDCIKLENLDDRLMAQFRLGSLSLEQVAAFATVPNPAAQHRLLLELGTFVCHEKILSAIKHGATVLELPGGDAMILPSRVDAGYCRLQSRFSNPELASCAA